MNIIGEVKGKKVILVDDMIDTAGTIVHAAQALVDKGATEVYACCTHPVLSGPAIERLEASPIQELVCLNTIELPPEKIMKKTKILSVAPIFAEAIERIYEDVSVFITYINQIKGLFTPIKPRASAVFPVPNPTPAAIPSGRLCIAIAITKSNTLFNFSELAG